MKYDNECVNCLNPESSNLVLEAEDFDICFGGPAARKAYFIVVIQNVMSCGEYSAIYRCPDDILNLKIRVRIAENSEPYHERTFSWQEKVFSKSEIELYKDEKNCVTDLEKKYHLDVKDKEEDESFRGNIQIYTYINEDSYTGEEADCTTSLTEKIEHIRTGSENNEEGQSSDGVVGAYYLEQSVAEAVRNPLQVPNFEFLHIVADLGEYVETTWIKYERVLCTLQWNRNNKALKIFPDFSKSRPYSFQIDVGTSRNFTYFIENVSEGISEVDAFREEEFIKKINIQKAALSRFRLDGSFYLPPKNKLRVHLFFEILSAREFEYDAIYVRFFIDLPSKWSTDDVNHLSGMTQTCRARHEEGSAHFGHTFEVILDYNIESQGISTSPYIYFEVISRDSWGRYRTEGLAYKNLPVGKPGNFRYDLQCFRLASGSVSGQLRRFFIGDCIGCDDITWIGIPKEHEGPILNKYGTCTLGTGLISLRINVLHQSQAFMEEFSENSVVQKEIFDKLNSSSLVKSVEQVLQAFRRARKDMVNARKNALLN